MKQLKPYLGAGLALWLVHTPLVLAQDDFYIELRGPESSAPNRSATTLPNESLTPVAPPPTSRPPAARAPAVASSASQPVANANRYGPIRSTDTLWAIASRHTRAPSTVQQNMVALYHLNPQAFVRGNINNLQRGVTLRMPTDTQARQRSPREAEAEFRRLSRQGNRRVTQAATVQPASPVAAKPPVQAPTPSVEQPQAPVEQPKAVPVSTPEPVSVVETAPSDEPVSEPDVQASAPTAATPPTLEPLADNGLMEPKAAATPVLPAQANTPVAAESQAQSRVQLQEIDELREQVSMSNEQLTALADNNQALRQRLTQLTAEVEELKNTRNEPVSAEPALEAPADPPKSGLNELLSSPLNLAMTLMLPVLLLLALFTLWWRNRERRNSDEQEQELSETTAMMEDEGDEFADLFADSDEDAGDDLFAEEQPDEAATEPEQEIDEDAFARFLEEQQSLEQTDADPDASEGKEDDFEALFEDELFEDEAVEEEITEDEPVEDELFEDELFEEEVFEDESVEEDIAEDESSTETTPEPETTVTPEAETTPEPEATVTPEAETTPEPEVTVTPEAETTPEPEATVTPEAEATPEPEASVTPEAETTPEPEATVTPEVETTPEPEATVTSDEMSEDDIAAALADAEPPASLQAQNPSLSETPESDDAIDDELAAALSDMEAPASLQAQNPEFNKSSEPDSSFEDEMAAIFASAEPPADLQTQNPGFDEAALFDQQAQLTDDDDTFTNDDVDDLFNVNDAAEEQQAEPEAKPNYVSVDDLMAEAERNEGPESEREQKLDLELEDYADVIGQGQDVDIDADEGGMGGQLDLARAYIEIDDLDSARELLNEVLDRGNEAQQKDARKLLQRLDKRG